MCIVYVYIYIYIYMQREREIYIYIYIYMYIYIACTYNRSSGWDPLRISTCTRGSAQRGETARRCSGTCGDQVAPTNSDS